MTFTRLVLRNLLYHWRGNVAVLFGVAVGTAVLTGALLVGDSLRGSLYDLTVDQLGWVDHALVTSRFFREELATELGVSSISPAIILHGAASKTSPSDSGDAREAIQRAGKVTVYGVDDRFWFDSVESYWSGARRTAKEKLSPSLLPYLGPRPTDMGLWESARDEVILNAALADELHVAPSDAITLHLQKVSTIPRETLLGRRDASEVVNDLKLTVRAVIRNEGVGRFSLNANPATPRNAFVSLRALQDKLQQKGRVNALLVGGGNTQELQEKLQENLSLDDWGLILHTPQSRAQALFDKLDRDHDGKLTPNEYRRHVAQTFVQAADGNHDGVLDREEVSAFYREHRSYLSLESRQLLLEPAVADAALAAAKEAALTAAPTLVYLANGISDGKEVIPYSVVAALDPSLPAPLGPFLPRGVEDLKDDEIVLADWKDSPLRVQPGDEVTLTYFLPEIEGRLQEQTKSFRLRGVVPLQGAANDPDLTPEFPGITDKLDIRDWNPPFPYDNNRVKRRDELYWEQYRTTPKAYVTLADGKRLWGSRFGQLTSIRLAPPSSSARGDSANLSRAAEDFRRRLLAHLSPESGGLVFENVRQRGLEESFGSTDFGWLFVGFSCFLIAAALLLVGLLFRLNLDRRASEIGLLLASGYRRRTLRRLLLTEGTLLAVIGGLFGLMGALLYAWLMLGLLRAWWPGSLDLSFLRLHVTIFSLFVGYTAAWVVSVLTVALAVRILGKVTPRALLAGETAEATSFGQEQRFSHWARWVTASMAAAALTCLVLGHFVRDHEMQAISFFGSGALLLTACLWATWTWMRGSGHGHISGRGWPALARLGVRNAARHPVRSLLTAGLVASATFLVVGVESFYRDPGKDFLGHDSGSGGFPLLGEADVPIYEDLNTTNGRDELNLPKAARAALQDVIFFPFRLRSGDDASCLNLYQPRRPRLLGVTPALVERGGFRFKVSEAHSAEERANPWRLLKQARDDDTIPVFGEANTVEWMLHSALGRELQVPNDRGESKRLRVVGLLQDSVFQSELLMAEANFLTLYPRQEGYAFFLIDAPHQHADQVKTLLETALADHGFYVTSTAQRLESYLAVENTYLSTFQALGGLGLVLGALGLAVVLLRSIWERRGELALLRALGFRERDLGWLVLAENGFLLVLGLGVGFLAALASVAPHLVSGTGEVPWLRLLGLLGLVLAVGLAAGAAAVASSLRTPLLPALRRE